jgi:hypothetical protein
MVTTGARETQVTWVTTLWLHPPSCQDFPQRLNSFAEIFDPGVAQRFLPAINLSFPVRVKPHNSSVVLWAALKALLVRVIAGGAETQLETKVSGKE